MRRFLPLLMLSLAACANHAVATTGPSAGAASMSPSPATSMPAPGVSTSASASLGARAGAPPRASDSPLPETVQGMEVAPLQVSLSRTCVVPGTQQQLTIKATPGYQVSYGTDYPDGGTHTDYGGAGVGTIPPSGTLVVPWIVPQGAPLGSARTDVAVTGKASDGQYAAALRHPKWTIARSC